MGNRIEDHRRLDLLVRLCGAVAIIIGAVLLVLWLIGVAGRWSVEGAIVMKTNMAVGLVLGGTALLLLVISKAQAAGRITAVFIAAVVFLIGILTLSEHILGYDMGIDQLLAHEHPGAAATAAPNRMGPSGALSLTILGMGLMALAMGRRGVTPYIGIAVCLINLVPLIGCLYGIKMLYSMPHVTGVAWPTVVAVLSLGVGLIMSVRDTGPMLLLLRDDPGGIMLRRILPAAIVIPLILGWLKVTGDNHDLLDPQTRTVLLVVGLIVVFGAVLWHNAVGLSRSDIERKRVEDMLRESEERMRFALETSHIGAWDLDLVDHTAHRSLEHDRILGYHGLLPKWTYEMFLEHVLVEDRPGVDAKFRKATETQSDWNFECRIRRVDGEVRWIWAAGRQFVDPFGMPRRMAGIVQDITERKKVETDLRHYADELAAANKELETFSYSISHDLRAPLLSIKSFSGVLIEDYGDILNAEGRGYLGRIASGTDKMGKLIDDMLRLAKISRQEMILQEIDLSAIAGSVVDDLRRAEPERTVDVAITRELKARGDPRFIHIALSNLIGNAWKYSGKTPTPQIVFGVMKKNGETIYYVRDNGAGFDMAHARKLFEPFQRLHPESQFPGTGIGLAIVNTIVRRHGGRIWAESAIGDGATFYFALS